MGLDTTHNCWHGPYSSFSRWRNEIAAAAGYAVWTVVDDTGWKSATVMLDWGHLGTPEHLAGNWEETPTDPLFVLIVHSDCDGAIYPAQAEPLAARLEEIVALGTLDSDDVRRARRFIEGLRAAAAKSEPVLFH
jgi:hypothetical protein